MSLRAHIIGLLSSVSSGVVDSDADLSLFFIGDLTLAIPLSTTTNETDPILLLGAT